MTVREENESFTNKTVTTTPFAGATGLAAVHTYILVFLRSGKEEARAPTVTRP